MFQKKKVLMKGLCQSQTLHTKRNTNHRSHPPTFLVALGNTQTHEICIVFNPLETALLRSANYSSQLVFLLLYNLESINTNFS